MSEVNNAFRVLVCGGRDYGWKIFSNGRREMDIEQIRFLNTKMNSLLLAAKEFDKDLIVIHGAAQGADTFAGEWAKSRSLIIEEYPADWSKHGKSAGFIRNAEMLKLGNPDLVIAFPGGNGTKMMCEIAEKAGVPVRSYANGKL
jgi:hypothetical protein